MTVIYWFFYRRWRMKRWIREYTREEKERLVVNLYKTNLANCREYPVIYRDMKKILV